MSPQNRRRPRLPPRRPPPPPPPATCGSAAGYSTSRARPQYSCRRRPRLPRRGSSPSSSSLDPSSPALPLPASPHPPRARARLPLPLPLPVRALRLPSIELPRRRGLHARVSPRPRQDLHVRPAGEVHLRRRPQLHGRVRRPGGGGARRGAAVPGAPALGGVVALQGPPPPRAARPPRGTRRRPGRRRPLLRAVRLIPQPRRQPHPPLDGRRRRQRVCRRGVQRRVRAGGAHGVAGAAAVLAAAPGEGSRVHLPGSERALYRVVVDRISNAVLLVSDFGRLRSEQASLVKDVILPYSHRINSFRGEVGVDSRPSLLFFMGNRYRKELSFFKGTTDQAVD